MKTVLKIGLLGLLAAAIAAPLQLRAQSTNKSTVETAPVAKKDAAKSEKQKSPHSFRGKLAKVDKTAKTIKVGESVYQVTADTKIMRGDKTVTLSEGVEGELVTGYVKPDEKGKMVASSIYFGGKNAKSSAKTTDQKPAKK